MASTIARSSIRRASKFLQTSVAATALLASALLVSALLIAALPAHAQDQQLPDPKSGFFESNPSNEDFFKQQSLPGMSGPLDRARFAPPPVPQKQTEPPPEEQNVEPSKDPNGLIHYPPASSAEDAEGANIKNEIFKRASEDSSMKELFDRARVIKQEIGVPTEAMLEPGDDPGNRNQLQERFESAERNKKKMESNRF